MRQAWIRSLLAACFIFMAWNAAAQSEVVQRYVSQAQKVGEDRLTYLFWDVYDASLYAPEGRFSPDHPFALQLLYLRALEGDQIAERSAHEMREQGYGDETQLQQWLQLMMRIFPDVKEGDAITGIRTREGHAVFYLNDRQIGVIEDSEFSERFFDIWLGSKSSEPAMRQRLLGL